MGRKQPGSSRGSRLSNKGKARGRDLRAAWAGRHAEALEQRFLLSITPIAASGSVPEGASQNLVVGTFSDSSPSLANAYAATIFWGDGTSSAGNVTTSNSGNFTVSGTHSLPDENAAALVTVSIAESNGADQDTGTINSSFTVSESDTLSGTLASFAATEGTAFSGAVATFSDAGNPGAVNTGFAATINWGDGTSTTGVVPTGASGSFTVSGAHTYADGSDATQTVSVILADNAPGTAKGTATGTLVVQENPFTVSGLPVSVAESGSLSGVTVATFSDPGSPTSGEFTASINWGDGTTTAGTVAGSAGNFSVTGTHAYVDEGSFTVSTTVIETGVNFTAAAAVSTATVTEADALAPLSGIFSPFSEGTSGTLTAYFSDTNKSNNAADLGSLINWGDGTSGVGTVTGSNGTFTLTGVHTYLDEQTSFASATISDDTPGTATASISGAVTVAEGDVFTPGSPILTLAAEGSASTLAAVFSDSNQLNAAGDFTGAINWGDGTSSTGTVTGASGGYTVTGTHVYPDEGSYTATATIADNAPGTATGTSAPVLAIPNADVITGSLAPITATEATAFSGTIATFTNTGYPANPSSDFTATINWGDGTTTANALSGTGTYTVNGAHTYADGNDGPQTVSVTLTDDAPGTTPVTATGTVVVGELAGTFSVAGVNPIGPEGPAGVTGVVATFTDTGSTDASSKYQASINWGDGTSSSGAVSGSNGSYTVAGAHYYADEGTYTVTTSVAEGEANFTATPVTSTATVLEGDTLGAVSTSPTLAAEGSATTLAAVFSDSNPLNSPGDFTGQINWGDGTSSTGLVTGGGAGNYTVTASHVYADEGSFTATATIADDATGSATGTTTATLSIPEGDVVSGSLAPIVATEATPFSGTVATFTNTGYPANPATDFTAAIKWGDGTSSAGTVSGTGTYSVSGSHAYADGIDGPQTVTVILSDAAPGTATATATGTIVVGELASTFSVVGATVNGTENAPVSGAVATFTDAGSTDAGSVYQASINWGDGTSSSGTVSGSAGSYSVAGTHTYADEGSYTVTTTVADSSAGFTATPVTSTATINDADVLAAASPQPAVTVQEGDFTTSLPVATFTNTAYPGHSASDFTATIKWGDGQTTAGTVSGGSGANLTVSGIHAYVEHGNYMASVTLVDDAAGAATATVANPVTVTEAPIYARNVTITGMEGTALTNQIVAAVYDANFAEPGDTASISWGDGTSSAGTLAVVGGGTSLVKGSHKYSEQGQYTITVTTYDDGVSARIVQSPAKIADAPLQLTFQAFSPKHGVTFSATVAAMVDGDPFNNQATDYKGTINWGDGFSSSATFAFVSPGHWSVKGSHSYAHSGPRTLKISVMDENSGPFSVSGMINVS